MDRLPRLERFETESSRSAQAVREETNMALDRIPDKNRTLTEAQEITPYLAGVGIDYEQVNPSSVPSTPRAGKGKGPSRACPELVEGEVEWTVRERPTTAVASDNNG